MKVVRLMRQERAAQPARPSVPVAKRLAYRALDGESPDAGLVKGTCVQPPIVVQALAVLTARDRPTCFHFRQNRHDATITIVAIEDTWKIRSMELLQERASP